MNTHMHTHAQAHFYTLSNRYCHFQTGSKGPLFLCSSACSLTHTDPPITDGLQWIIRFTAQTHPRCIGLGRKKKSVILLVCCLHKQPSHIILPQQQYPINYFTKWGLMVDYSSWRLHSDSWVIICVLDGDADEKLILLQIEEKIQRLHQNTWERWWRIYG